MIIHAPFIPLYCMQPPRGGTRRQESHPAVFKMLLTHAPHARLLQPPWEPRRCRQPEGQGAQEASTQEAGPQEAPPPSGAWRKDQLSQHTSFASLPISVASPGSLRPVRAVWMCRQLPVHWPLRRQSALHLYQQWPRASASLHLHPSFTMPRSNYEERDTLLPSGWHDEPGDAKRLPGLSSGRAAGSPREWTTHC